MPNQELLARIGADPREAGGHSGIIYRDEYSGHDPAEAPSASLPLF